MPLCLLGCRYLFVSAYILSMLILSVVLVVSDE